MSNARETYTNQIADPGQTWTPERMLAEMRKLAAEPQYVGDIGGIAVYVSRTVPEAMIEFRNGDQVTRFSLEHPYIQGTKLERDVRAWLDNA